MIGASGLHDVIFEGLTIRNATWGIAVNEGARITVRRCTIADVENGLVAQRNGQRQQRFLLADNMIIGRATWPRTRGIEERGGVRLGGIGSRGLLQPHPRICRRDLGPSGLSLRGDRLLRQRDLRVYGRRHRNGLLRAQHALLREPPDQRVPGHLVAARPRRSGVCVPQRDVQRGQGNVQAAQWSVRRIAVSQHVGQVGNAVGIDVQRAGLELRVAEQSVCRDDGQLRLRDHRSDAGLRFRL